MTQLNPFLRDATFTLLPVLTDEQLEGITERLTSVYPHLLVRRLTQHSALVQGIAIRAEDPHRADARTWEIVSGHVRASLADAGDSTTKIASIDVRPAAGALR